MKKINQWACYNRIWSWSPMPCEKHGPRASVTTKTSAFGLGFCLLQVPRAMFFTRHGRPWSNPTIMTSILVSIPIFNNCDVHGSCGERSASWEVSGWVIRFNGLLRTVDTVHISPYNPYIHVIITYTLESLSSLTKITHNLQVTINFRKKWIKHTHTQSEGTHIRQSAWLNRVLCHSMIMMITETDTSSRWLPGGHPGDISVSLMKLPCIHIYLIPCLTRWGRDKMAAFLQTTF